MKGFAEWQILFLFAKTVGKCSFHILNNHISSWTAAWYLEMGAYTYKKELKRGIANRGIKESYTMEE